MRKFIALIISNFLFFISYGQINADSLIGKYIYQEEIGGGFTGGINGSCVTVDPDGIITNTIKIDSDLVIYKTTDTTKYLGTIHVSLDSACDTLYIGNGQITNDTLIVSYIKKPICSELPELLNTDTAEEPQQIEKLQTPLIEKYHIRHQKNRPYALTLYSNGYEEYHRESDISTLKNR